MSSSSGVAVPPAGPRGFVLGPCVGQGSFGRVYKGRRMRGAHETLAIKCVGRRDLRSAKELEDNVVREIALLKALKHTHIVELVEFAWDAHYIYIVTEYCSRGDLSHYIKLHKRLSEKVVKIFLGQLASALAYLRAREVAHLDLKPQNLLINWDFKLKLADFGLAQFFDSSNMGESLRGSLLYMAPEMALGRRYDAKVDIWSIGVIVYECCFGTTPFKSSDVHQLMSKIKNTKEIDIPCGEVKLSEECLDLMRRCLVRDPSNRIDFDAFFGHTFVNLHQASSHAHASNVEQVIKEKRSTETRGEDHTALNKGLVCQERRASGIAVTSEGVEGHGERDELMRLATTTSKLSSGLEIAIAAEMYENEGSFTVALEKYELAFSLLIPLLKQEPKATMDGIFDTEPGVQPQDDEESLMVSRVIHVHISSDLHCLDAEETLTLNSASKVSDVLKTFLTTHKAPSLRTMTYALRDEDGLILSPKSTLDECRVRSDDNLYVCVLEKNGYNLTKVNVALLLFCSLVALTLVGCVIYAIYEKDGKIENQYGIVIDAGSVHTTYYVYKWSSMLSDLQEIYVCEQSSKQGISDFVSNPKMVQKFILSECLIKAVNLVSEGKHVQVFLGASAGMRLLNFTNPLKAKAVMANLSEALNTIDLPQKPHVNVAILSEREEALDAWIAVNFMSQVFTNEGSSRPLGSIDWGGASLQIGYPSLNATSTKVSEVNIFNKNFKVVTSSHLCYGQAEAIKRYYAQLIYENYRKSGDKMLINPRERIMSACAPKDMVLAFSPQELFSGGLCTRFLDDDFMKYMQKISQKSVNFTFEGLGDMEECRKGIQQQLNEAQCKLTFSHNKDTCIHGNALKIDSETRFMAISTFYYLLRQMNLDPSRVTRKAFEDVTEEVCKSNRREVEQLIKHNDDKSSVAHTCFKALFMLDLLDFSLNFKDWSRIGFAKDVSGTEINWSLGYSLLNAHRSGVEGVSNYSDFNRNNNDHVSLSFAGQILFAFMACIFVFLAIFFLWHLVSRRNSGNAYAAFVASIKA